MSKITDKILRGIANVAEDAFWEASGFASQGGVYEPEMPESAKRFKPSHESRVDKLFDKLVK